MIAALAWTLLTQIPIVFFGAAVALLPSARAERTSDRFALAWLGGAALLTALAPLLSLAGSWGERSLAIPLVVLAVGIPALTRGRRKREQLPSRPLRRVHPWPLMATLLALFALGLAAASIASGRALAPSVFTSELGKAHRWIAESIDPQLMMASDPAAPPASSLVPMWSGMVDTGLSTPAGAWIPLLLLIASVPLLLSRFDRVLDRSASRLLTAGVLLSGAMALFTGRFAGGSDAWLLILTPAAALSAALAPRQRLALGVLCATVAAADRAGLLVVALLVVSLVLDGERRSAVVAGLSAVGVLMPWYLLLAVDGLAPWSGALVPPVQPWHPADSGLLLIAATALLLIALRWRRWSFSRPTLLVVLALIAAAVAEAAGVRNAGLLALRTATPLLVATAGLLVLRPLPMRQPPGAAAGGAAAGA